MKRYLLLLFFLIQLVNVKAQATQGGQSFTLEQCLAYALDNSNNVKNSKIDEQIAEAKVKETRGIGLPQIDGTVSVRHNQKLSRFFTTYVDPADLPEGSFSFAPQIPGAKTGDVVAGQNFFQLPSSGDAGLTINQILFNGSYLVGLRAANTYRELSERTSNQTREQTIEQVIKAFYTVLINNDRMKLFDNNIARVDSLLKSTKALFENGFAESIDVDRIKVSLNNLNSERTKFYNLQELSVQLLKFQMNYPMDQPIQIEGDIASITIDENLLSNYETEWNYSERTEYQLMETNRKLATLDLKNEYSASMPSLVAFANLGYSTQSDNIAGVFKTNSDKDIDFQGYGPDKWYSYSLFGVSLKIPIFSGLQRTYRVQQSKLELQKIENTFSTLKSSIDLEVKQAAINYTNAVTTLKSQEENMGLAKNVARITKIKYEQGVGSNLEVVEAESDLREAQINYYSSLYDAIVAKVDLDRAYGKLDTTAISQNK
jgi:outer membrane protein TolC